VQPRNFSTCAVEYLFAGSVGCVGWWPLTAWPMIHRGCLLQPSTSARVCVVQPTEGSCKGVWMQWNFFFNHRSYRNLTAALLRRRNHCSFPSCGRCCLTVVPQHRPPIHIGSFAGEEIKHIHGGGAHLDSPCESRGPIVGHSITTESGQPIASTPPPKKSRRNGEHG
jgi:hypothetical protein